MGEKMKSSKGLIVKEEYREAVVTYIRRVTAFSVRLCDASPDQLKIIHGLYPDYFEAISKDTDKG